MGFWRSRLVCQGRQTPDSRSGLAPRASPPSLDPASCGPLTAAMGLRPSPQPEAGPWRPADTTGLFLGPRCSGRGVWGWPWQQSQLGKGWRPSWPFSPRPRPLPFRPAVGRPGLTAARSVDFPGDWGGVEMAVRTLPELPVQCLGLALGDPETPGLAHTGAGATRGAGRAGWGSGLRPASAPLSPPLPSPQANLFPAALVHFGAEQPTGGCGPLCSLRPPAPRSPDPQGRGLPLGVGGRPVAATCGTRLWVSS